jgi:CRISPR-associated protein Cas2
MQLAEFERRLVRCINEKEDSLRIYRLREDREQYLKIYGIAHDIDFDAPLIV